MQIIGKGETGAERGSYFFFARVSTLVPHRSPLTCALCSRSCFVYLFIFCFINFIGLSLSKYQKVRCKRYLESHAGHLQTKSVNILRNAY